MKRLGFGFVALGFVIGLRPLARRIAQKMQQHCAQMVAQLGGRAEAVRTTPAPTSPAADAEAAPERVAA